MKHATLGCDVTMMVRLGSAEQSCSQDNVIKSMGGGQSGYHEHKPFS